MGKPVFGIKLLLRSTKVNKITVLGIYGYIRSRVFCVRSGFINYIFATFHVKVKRKIAAVGMKLNLEVMLLIRSNQEAYFRSLNIYLYITLFNVIEYI